MAGGSPQRLERDCLALRVAESPDGGVCATRAPAAAQNRGGRRGRMGAARRGARDPPPGVRSSRTTTHDPGGWRAIGSAADQPGAQRGGCHTRGGRRGGGGGGGGRRGGLGGGER